MVTTYKTYDRNGKEIRVTIPENEKAADRAAVPTREQFKAIAAIVDAILDTVREAGPLGAPAGPMYAAMMAFGFTLEQFEQMMSGIVKAGKLRKQGDLYFIAGGVR